MHKEGSRSLNLYCIFSNDFYFVKANKERRLGAYYNTYTCQNRGAPEVPTMLWIGALGAET
jgi:ABC-type arginine transport system permease subunit